MPFSSISQGRLDELINDKEKSCPRSGANEGRANTRIDTAKSAGTVETSRRLQASLEGVNRVERKVDCGACESACLSGEMSVLRQQLNDRDLEVRRTRRARTNGL